MMHTDPLIDTESISSDRFHRRSETSYIEINFEVASQTDTVHVHKPGKSRPSATIRKADGRHIESSTSSDEAEAKRPGRSEMTRKKYASKKGRVQNAQKKNPPENSELHKVGNSRADNNDKVTAYDFNTDSEK